MTSAACDRAELIDAIATFVSRKSGLTGGAVRLPIERAINDLGARSVENMQARLAAPNAEWAYYPGDPLARRVHHLLAPVVLRDTEAISGIDHLCAVEDVPRSSSRTISHTQTRT